MARVMPVVEVIKKRFPIPLSIDTSTPSVMRAAITLGVDMINDVRALTGRGTVSLCRRRRLYCSDAYAGHPSDDAARSTIC